MRAVFDIKLASNLLQFSMLYFYDLFVISSKPSIFNFHSLDLRLFYGCIRPGMDTHLNHLGGAVLLMAFYGVFHFALQTVSRGEHGLLQRWIGMAGAMFP